MHSKFIYGKIFYWNKRNQEIHNNFIACLVLMSTLLTTTSNSFKTKLLNRRFVGLKQSVATTEEPGKLQQRNDEI